MAGYWLDNSNLAYIHLILLLIFFLLTTSKTAKKVLFSGDIDGNKILGAICLYILLGLIWALFDTLTELSIHQSFTGISENNNWYELLPTFVYFSFLSLTTLGFGDISPTLPLSQFMVYIEAIIGQFYMAILVASLVGSRMTIMSKK